mmetsp:Transcript_26767/g.44399  ORF Transcript_26767/g.44399 Transcript_26767/m.44399 type:complete len:84 (-) Transcript_26767:99-350(-)
MLCPDKMCDHVKIASLEITSDHFEVTLRSGTDQKQISLSGHSCVSNESEELRLVSTINRRRTSWRWQTEQHPNDRCTLQDICI